MVQTFGIIGSGSWATALAKILTDNKHAVNWWIRNAETIEHFRKRHHNPHYLSSVNFDVSLLTISANMEKVINNSDILVVAIPSAFVEESFVNLPDNIFQGKKIVSAIKGILPNKNILFNYYLQQQFGVPLENYFEIGRAHV